MSDTPPKPLAAFRNSIALLLIAQNWDELKTTCNIDNSRAEQIRLEMKSGWREIIRIRVGAMVYCEWVRNGKIKP